MSDHWEERESSQDLLEYARGFLLSYGAPKRIPETWVKLEIKGWMLSYDPRVPLDMYSSHGRLVVILGHSLFIGEDTVSENPARIICNALANENSQEYIDLLCGRFTLFIFEKSVRVQQDAAGLKAVFYSKQYSVAGSHPALVADQTGSKKGKFARELLDDMKLRCMPGNATEYEGIFAQTPNTELSVAEASTRRIYYGDLPKRQSAEDVSRTLIELVRKQIPWLSTLDPVISLSAGLDSRTSLALLRPMTSVLKGFTYTSELLRKNSNALHDLETARKLAKVAEIDFQVLDTDEFGMDSQIRDSLRSNFYRGHGAKLAGVYVDKIPNQMNIRSNIFGIGRASYENSNVQTFDARGMSRLAFGQNKHRDEPSVLEAFETYARDTDFPTDADVCFKDLFFWEHRIGVWQTAIYIEADLSHYSHVLLNQRDMLRQMLSVPKEDRINGEVLKTTIRTMWPELATFDINGEAF